MYISKSNSKFGHCKYAQSPSPPKPSYHILLHNAKQAKAIRPSAQISDFVLGGGNEQTLAPYCRRTWKEACLVAKTSQLE